MMGGMKKLFLFLFLISCTQTQFKNPVFNGTFIVHDPHMDFFVRLTPEAFIHKDFSYKETVPVQLVSDTGNSITLKLKDAYMTLNIVDTTSDHCGVQAFISNGIASRVHELTASIPCKEDTPLPRRRPKFFFKDAPIADHPVNPVFRNKSLVGFNELSDGHTSDFGPFPSFLSKSRNNLVMENYFRKLCHIIDNTKKTLVLECMGDPANIVSVNWPRLYRPKIDYKWHAIALEELDLKRPDVPFWEPLEQSIYLLPKQNP